MSAECAIGDLSTNDIEMYQLDEKDEEKDEEIYWFREDELELIEE